MYIKSCLIENKNYTYATNTYKFYSFSLYHPTHVFLFFHVNTTWRLQAHSLTSNWFNIQNFEDNAIKEWFFIHIFFKYWLQCFVHLYIETNLVFILHIL